jgi:uncharacterized protein
MGMTSTIATRRLSGRVSSQAATRLRAFRAEAEHALPGKIVMVVLFGSRARGEARSDSDYDVAVFVKDLHDRRFVDHTLSDAAYPHILAGTHIRPVAVPDDYLFSNPRATLARDIVREGIPIR